MNLLPQLFYRMVVIDLLSMVGDGGGCGGVALGGRWEGVGGWWGLGLGVWFIGKSNRYIVAGILNLLVDRYVDEIRIRSSFFTYLTVLEILWKTLHLGCYCMINNF